MSLAFVHFAQPFNLSWLQQAVMVNGEMQRVSFAVTATRKQHARLQGQLNSELAIDALFTFRDPEED